MAALVPFLGAALVSAAVTNAVSDVSRSVTDAFMLYENIEESHFRKKTLANDLTRTYLDSANIMSIARSQKYGSGVRTDNVHSEKAFEIMQFIRNDMKYKR